jgi:hypothetical protein
VAATTIRRLRWALLEPARNLHLCSVLVLLGGLVLVVEAFLFPSKAAFAVAAASTMAAALLFIHAASKAEEGRLERVLARLANGVGLAIRPAGAPSLFAMLLYCAGIIAIVAGYAWFALTRSGVSREDVIVQWGLLDKRPLVFAYLAVVALMVFHQAMVRLFFAPPYPAHGERTPARRSWIARLFGAAAVAVLAYGLFGASILRDVVPAGGNELAKFYEYHSLVHLGALEQIRLGAVPYVEAQTQYGLGNQLLLYWLTKSFGFSNHGFYAGVLLVDVVCIVAFFVVVQQILGLGWALAGLLGWMLWPSPDGVLHLAGWAILTRWIAVPVVALLLARLLLAAGPQARGWIGAVVVGAIWGAGGFMSQENLSGGLLVFLLSLALYGPAGGQSLAWLARFFAFFLASGVAAFALLVAASIGILHSIDVLRQASAQSGLVMAGLSNSIWSEEVGLTLSLHIVHGWAFDFLKVNGDLRPLLQTYGFALLLMLAIGLLARFLARSWNGATTSQRGFAWKFAGVAVGAYGLHLFTLLRSDLSHLAGPSFLLPLFLIALPAFAWHCLRPGVGRGILLLASVGIVADAAIAGGAEVGRRVGALGAASRDTMAAVDVYRALRAASNQPLDIVSRYSPITQYQTAFRDRPDFAELQELANLLREKLHGRPVELVLPTPDDPMNDPELLYFFGGFRSITGVTSPRGSLWPKSDEEAWIDRILRSRNACVFFDEKSVGGRLFQAWNDAVRNGPVTSEPIVGRRPNGVLSCKA